jgi:hypothetical protein
LVSSIAVSVRRREALPALWRRKQYLLFEIFGDSALPLARPRVEIGKALGEQNSERPARRNNITTIHPSLTTFRDKKVHNGVAFASGKLPLIKHRKGRLVNS